MNNISTDNLVRVHIWGERACFTRPEMKVERVSYDVITPSAARGILEAIHWKPAIRWIINRIHVLRPIKFESFRRNELSKKISPQHIKRGMKNMSTEDLFLFIEDNRQQRGSLILRDVEYVIEAHMIITRKASDEDNLTKHLTMFKRRLDRGQCFHQPYLGTREFPAHFASIEGVLPNSRIPINQQNRDLGRMLYDIEFATDHRPVFFEAIMRESVIEIPSPDDVGITL